MKIKLLFFLILFSIFNISSAAMLNKWEILSTFDFPGNYAYIKSFGTDSNGNMYRVGILCFPNNHGIIQKSADGGYTWKTIDESGYHNFGFAADKLGNIYVAGSSEDYHGLIRKSSDGGQTWKNVYLDPDGFSEATAVAVAPNGDIYAGEDGHYGTFGMIRKSVDQGVTWQTVDVIHHSNSSPIAIKFDANGNVYTFGNFDYDPWYVRVSKDKGATWTTLDTFSYEPDVCVEPRSAAVDPAGNIYVAGNSFECRVHPTIEHWLVRKGTLNGGWSTVDDFKYSAKDYGSKAFSMAIDKNGVVFVSGEGTDEATTRAILRVSQNGGQTWSTMEEFNSPYQYSGASFTGILFDSFGQRFMSAECKGNDGGVESHWITGK